MQSLLGVVLFVAGVAFTNGAPYSNGSATQSNLPQCLDRSLDGSCPWNNSTNGSKTPSTMPRNGRTRRYDFTVQRQVTATDGYSKNGLLIDGQFPAPLIEANWGDWIEVTLTNAITEPEEGTSLHWHGLLQKGSQEYDGVPSITQCPIAPGQTFTYRFQATVYGTTWYHSHYSGQYAGGAHGPLVIYGPSPQHYDEDLGIILLEDWFHNDYLAIVRNVMSNDTALQSQASDNTVINGRMPFNCSLAAGTPCNPDAGYSKFRVTAGKTYRLRLVNSGAGGIQYFSIDNHNLTIITNDFVDIIPYEADRVTLGIGQRSDVLFTPQPSDDAIWMRTLQSGRFCARANQPEGRAIILVNNATDTSIPTTTALPPPFDDYSCKNDDLSRTVPYYPQTPPPPTTTYDLVVNQFINATGHKLFYMNGYSFQGSYNDPVLLEANNGNDSYPYNPQWRVVDFGTNSSIRVNVWNNNTSPHPMHLHGHEYWVLNEGNGQWDGHTVINPQNPLRRDTHNLRPNGYMVLQYSADNPGVWPFHCHIAWHLSTGLSITFMERPAEIPRASIATVMDRTCTPWGAWTKTHVVDQIDDGL